MWVRGGPARRGRRWIAPLVGVGAWSVEPDSAKINFGEDRSPTIATLHKPADFRPLGLRSQVVEFENNRVGLATVNASMLSEVLPDSRLQCSPPRGCVTNVPSDVRLAIARIVRPSV